MNNNQGHRIDDRELIYVSEETCQCGNGSSHRRAIHTTTGANKCSSVRAIALTLFLLASAYWFYKVYTNATGGYNFLGWESPATKMARLQQASSRSQLKLISVFNRHGDRAPSDSLPPGDDMAQQASMFWPNGLNELTDSGRFRQFRLGLELRRRYERHLDYNAAHFLALSSPMQRCRDSLELTLAGLFDIDITLARGLQFVRQFNLAKAACHLNDSTQCIAQRLPSGTGSPLEWKSINLDSQTMPMLEYKYLNNCKYRLDNPTPVDVNLEASVGVAKLGTTLGLWSTLAGELRLTRTNESFAYGQHSFNWATQQVAAYENVAPITLFDLYEQVTLLGYRDRIQGEARRVQLGPLLTSLVTSQQVALAAASNHREQINLTEQVNSKLNFDSPNLYGQKRIVIYSSHDSILQLLMHQLGIIRANAANYPEQFNKWHRANDADQLLQGLRMSQFGMSLVFELYEMMDADGPPPPPPVDAIGTSTNTNHSNKLTIIKEPERFAYVQAALYNEADAKYKPIEYQRLDLGRICRRLFDEQNPTLASKSSNSANTLYYQNVKFPLDETRSCPFELFKNVTRNMMISSQELNKLCG